MKRLVIAIAGGSGSGKTLLAETLAEKLKEVTLLGLDAFYRDQSALTHEERTKVNYDDPATIDFEEYCNILKQLKEGEKHILVPVYDFVEHVRLKPRVIESSPLIITEGTMTFIPGPHCNYFDYKIYVKASGDIRLLRRIRRDVAERGRSASSVLDQYLASVRPMHKRWISPEEKDANYIFYNDAMDGLEEAEVDELVTIIRRLQDEKN